MKIILGSSSPRRKELLGQLIDSFEIISPDVDETHLPEESPDDFVLRMSREKGSCILSSPAAENSLIITSDTIVTIDGIILGKPAHKEDAVNILSMLSGKPHRVITGISLLVCDANRNISRELTDMEATQVRFKKLSREQILAYLDRITYMDKAGAYAIQEFGDMIVEDVNGSISNVIGFPLGLFFSMLGSMNLLQELKPGTV
ncbi:MAG: septum formation protein Maf [bacterium]|nr:septum formation protein Maf [bacterium]